MGQWGEAVVGVMGGPLGSSLDSVEWQNPGVDLGLVTYDLWDGASLLME